MKMHKVRPVWVKKGMPKWVSALICLAIIIGIFTMFAVPMGLSNMFSTFMNTAYRILVDTCLYIMAIAVLMGALSAIFTEFGVVDMLNKLLSPLMRPIYDQPGAAALGIVTTYLSDNPAILSLAEDRGFRAFFKKYQLPALTNIGTSFGMGLIVTTFMLGQEGAAGTSLVPAILIGNLAAIIGSIISTRIMLGFTKKLFGKENPAVDAKETEKEVKKDEKPENLGMRTMNAILEGGKSGVNLGLAIIPGVVIICTIVMMLTNAMPEGGYTGAAYEGIGLLPVIAGKINFILKPLFGFASAGGVSVPITALGSAGAAMGLVPNLLKTGLANAHDVAVFTAMCMCWSGYLSTHVSMMDSLGFKYLTGKAILSHTIGGFAAGIAANWLYKLAALIFSL
jgi:nucleoside recognition membrane protein YjiH